MNPSQSSHPSESPNVPGKKAAALYETHVAHELARFADDRLEATLAQEIGAVYDWLSEQPVERLGRPEDLKQLLRDRLIQAPWSEEGAAFIEACIARSLRDLAARPEKTEDVISYEGYRQAVRTILEDEQMRRAIIHASVNNEVFSMLISEILYNGIQEFFMENKLTQGIPGVDALFKAGQNLFSGSGLRDSYERTVKDFIRTNAGRMTKNSEEFLNKSMTPELIEEAADQLWNEAKARGVREAVDYLPPEKLPRLREPVRLSAEKLRASELFAILLDGWAETFFATYGAHPVQRLFEEAGLDRAGLLRELGPATAGIVRAARDGGFLEARIRTTLAGFYSSDAAQKLIG